MEMSVIAAKSIIFLTVQLLIINSQVLDEHLKPLDKAITISCTVCNNNSCLITINNVVVDYNVSAGGMLTLPPNNLTVYGTVICNGSNEQMKYLICPPNIGVYNWLQIISSATTITVGDTVEISAIFLHLPHNGVTLKINGSVPGDHDSPMSCTAKNPVINKIVNYTCIARQPGIKKIEVQLTFCSITFNSSMLITIVPLNQSTSSSTAINGNMTTSNTMSSSTMVLSSIVPSSTMATTSSSLGTTTQTINTSESSSSSLIPSLVARNTAKPNEDDNGLTPGETAAIVVPVAFVVVFAIAAIMTCIYFKYRRATPGVINMQMQINNSLSINVPPGNGHVSTGNGANNGHLSSGNGNIPASNSQSDPSNANGNLAIPTNNDDVLPSNAEALRNPENSDVTDNAHTVPQQATDDDTTSALDEMRNEEVERLSMPSMSFMEASTSGINEQRAALTGFNGHNNVRYIINNREN